MLVAMYKLLKSDSVEMAGRRRARQALLGMNDRLLEDAGFSRELLNRGVSAWPWRYADAEPAAVEASASTQAEHVRIDDVRTTTVFDDVYPTDDRKAA